MVKNWLKETHKKQKNNTEKRCANQRSALAILNVKVSNQQFEIEQLKQRIEFAKQAVDLFFQTEDESKLLEIAEWE